MQGNPKVIAALNHALRAELIAINQYFLHGEMQRSWGYAKLGGFIRKQSIDEMRHAERLMARILFLEGTPGMSMKLPLKPGKNAKAQLESDLALENEAYTQYNAAVQLCADQGDNTSSELIRTILTDEEKHIDFLEAQLHLIGEIGIQNYLARQMADASEAGG